MQQNASFKVDSKYFIDRLETDLVQLAKAISVEHSIDIEQAKMSARNIMQTRLNQLLTKDEQTGILSLKEDTVNVLKNNFCGTSMDVIIAKKTYELMKTFSLI